MMNLAFLDVEQPERPMPAALEASVIDHLRRVTELVPPSRWHLASVAVARLLTMSGSAKIRNAAALALADMRYRDAASVINSVAARREVALTAGTLLYALDELGGQVSFEAALNVFKFGSYEARAELLMLIDKAGIADLDEDHRSLMVAELSRLSSEDEEAAEAARLALDLLDQAPTSVL